MPRLLHTSDVHVGDTGGEPGPAFLALRAVVDLAVRERVDLVVFAGDLFDSNRVPVALSDLVARELARLPMPAVVLPGNHDPLDDASVYHRMDLPPNVALVAAPGGETLRFPDLELAVWGRPHLSYSHDVLPLRDPPPPTSDRWQVAVGHGHLVRSAEDSIRSYQIRPAEIAACGRHYVALGHWDVHHDVSQGGVAAAYSGSPARFGVSALVTLDGSGGGHGTRVERVEVAGR